MPGDTGGPAVTPAHRAAVVVRRVAALATAGMLALSWPLWVGSADFPRVPFLKAMPQATGFSAWLLFVSLVVAVAGSAGRGRWRASFGASLGLFVVLIAQDQHRFQPWVYQYAMTLVFLAAMPGAEGLRYARWWFVALYLHSGLSKLDASFCAELGPVFLRTALAPAGLDPTSWGPTWRGAAVLAMPAGEIALAWALAVPAARRFGRVAAVGLHVGLIGILGPAGLGHSTIVLVWNAAVMVEVWIAFGTDLAERPDVPPRGSSAKRVFWVLVVMPFAERWGLWDVWPSHALYASHVEKVAVMVHDSAVDRYPAAIRKHLERVGEGPWMRVNLTGWSREVRGTPVYPQNRAGLGVAEALAGGYGGPLPVRVVAFGPADRWTGRRARAEATGLGQIRGLGERFLCNAHPWPGGRGDR